MRKLLLFWLLLAAAPVLAQRTGGAGTNIVIKPPTPLPYFCNESVSRRQHTADSLLQALDKSQIPTHILYDRVPGLAALTAFNRLHNDPDTSGVNHFLQAYYELHVADYTNPGTEPCRQVLADNAAHYRRQGTILLGVLRYRFNYIDTNAVRNNQLHWDTSAPSKLFDVAGRSGSPYLQGEVAVAAALADSSNSGTVSFRLDPASIFTNTGAALSSASIDFGDGGAARTCTPGQTLAVSYNTAGRKLLRYVLTYADGSQFTTYSSLYVARAAVYSRGLNFVEPCRIASLTADISYQGVAGQAQVSYYYDTAKVCGNNTARPITRPVIIVDGIDYEGDREGGDIYGEYLIYRDGNEKKNLGEELRIAGYDVVILDFPNVESPIQIGPFGYFTITRHSGADYMERNAYTLVKLIQDLNQQMQAANPGTTEQIVVVGPSMGGQVSRYALTYMEKRYNDPSDAAYHNSAWNHNTRLWISLDSPNNGATIPIGLQHFVKYAADELEDVTARNNLALLDAPASRELTLHYYGQGTSFQADPLRTNFVTTLSGLGNYPSQLRRVAVADGAIDGTAQRDQNGQVIRANEQAFGLEQRGLPNDGSFASTAVRILWPFAGVLRLITLAAARVNFAPEYGQTRQVLYGYKFPHGHYQEATGPAGSCSLDGAPGGFRYFFSFAANYRGDLFENRNFYSVRDKACFIPTLSALGYTQPADNCQAAGQGLVCAGTTPFDAYYGPTGHNDEHLHLTPENVEFMRNEILQKTPTPVFTAAPTAICTDGGTASFSVATCLSRAGQPTTTYTWTVGSGLTIVSGQGTPTVVVASTVGYTGITTLQVVATRTGYVVSASAQVPVRLGGHIQAEGPRGTECYYSDLTYTLESTLAAGQVEWHVYLDNVPHDEFITADYGTSLVVRATAVGDMRVEATDYEACPSARLLTASINTTISNVMPDPPGSVPRSCIQPRPALARPVAYPNPADAVLNLATPEPASGGSTRTAALYNAQGREVRRTRTGTDQLPTADLPEGLYYLMVEQQSRITRSQIQVKH